MYKIILTSDIARQYCLAEDSNPIDCIIHLTVHGLNLASSQPKPDEVYAAEQ